MKFFVPEITDDKETETIYAHAKRSAVEGFGWQVSDRRIRRISYREGGKLLQAEVGKPDPITGEPVMAIFESTTYLICTENRGVRQGAPILVGRHEVIESAEFEQ